MNTKANIVALLHLIWIIFAIVSLPLVFIFDCWSRASLLFVAVTVLSWFVFQGCLFLKLENKYRTNGGNPAGLGEDSFIQFYLKKFFRIHVTRTAVRVWIYMYMALLGILSARILYS